MPDNPSPGDSTEASADPNYGPAEIQQKQTDPSKIATSEESLKALVDLLGGGGGGSGAVHDEDAAHSSGDLGVQILAVRNDTLKALADTDGDYTPLQVDASGSLYIQEGSALDVSASTVTTDPSAQEPHDVRSRSGRPIEAEGEIDPSGSEQQVPLSDASGGDDLSEFVTVTIGGDDYVDVRGRGRLTVVGQKNGTDTIFSVKARETRSTDQSESEIASADTSSDFSGSEDDVARNLDILDVSFFRLTENGAAQSDTDPIRAFVSVQ